MRLDPRKYIKTTGAWIPRKRSARQLHSLEVFKTRVQTRHWGCRGVGEGLRDGLARRQRQGLFDLGPVHLGVSSHGLPLEAPLLQPD